jgi:hypothetical protein
MREAGHRRGDRAVRWALLVGALLMTVGVACGDDTGEVTSPGADSSGATSSGLTGTWVTASGYDDVTMVLREDGAFTWDNRTLGPYGQSSGTWTADATTLTFSFVEDEVFCPGGTLTWEYRLDGDTLTSEGIAGTCGGPDVPTTWEFERQAGS